MTKTCFRFRPHEHLRRPADFRRVFERRRSVSDAWLIVYGCENGLPHLRLGLSVSRKFGQATHRIISEDVGNLSHGYPISWVPA